MVVEILVWTLVDMDVKMLVGVLVGIAEKRIVNLKAEIIM